MNRQRQSKGGFTLLETVVGMTLMAAVFGSAYASYFLGLNIIEDAREELRATQIIQSELERLRTITWVELTALATVSSFEPQGEFVKMYSGMYATKRKVEDVVVVGANAGLKQVTLYVSWTSRRGKERTQVFSTLFAENGLSDYYYRQAPPSVQ